MTNLTNRHVYQKTPKGNKTPTAAQRKRWEVIRALGCIIRNHECAGRTTIHHTGTGAGGRKNHDKVIPLCWTHHLGEYGIDSLTGAMSRREWESRYGTEKAHLEALETLLKQKGHID